MIENRLRRVFIGLIVLLICTYSANAQQVSGVNKFQTGVTYNVDDLVSSSGVIYKALLQNATMPPNDNWVSFVTLDDLPPSTNPIPLDYSVIWTGTGLVFDVTALRYYIVDTYYSATAAEITLDAADATNDRIDLIVADTSGVISEITGTPSASPAEPNYDLATQFPLKFILVSAGGTVPDGVSNTLVYDENVGSAGGEWDSVNSIAGQPYSATVGDYNSTEQAYSGTKSTKLNTDTNSINYASWSNSTGISIEDLNAITFWIKLPSDQTGNSLQTVIMLSPDEILTGNDYWGYTGINLDYSSTEWQQYIVPVSLKEHMEYWYGSDYIIKSLNLMIEKVGGGTGIDIYIDKVEIQTDTAAPVTPPTGAYAPLSHVSNYTNPHQVTKTQVGLSNVPNTDFTTAIGLNTAKVSFDSTSSTRLANTSGTNTGDQDLSGKADKTNVLELNNTTSFTPSADYQPATKKYVDDNAGGGNPILINDATAASISKVGTMRYRVSGNNSYIDIVMQTGAATYAWINIVQNNW